MLHENDFDESERGQRVQKKNKKLIIENIDKDHTLAKSFMHLFKFNAFILV